VSVLGAWRWQKYPYITTLLGEWRGGNISYITTLLDPKMTTTDMEWRGRDKCVGFISFSYPYDS
jgi:hypothetical protein